MENCKESVRVRMNDSYMSFYLRRNRVHIYVDALRSIGSPKHICMMISDDRKTLLLAPYPRKDYRSYPIDGNVYSGDKNLEISSISLCRFVARLYQWNFNNSYRVPGTFISKPNSVVFYLEQAEIIEWDKDESLGSAKKVKVICSDFRRRD